MSSKFAIKGILAVSLLFIMSVISSTAGAITYPITTSSTSCTLAMRAAGTCSIEGTAVMKGLGSATNDPTAFTLTILIQEGQIVFQNPAGKSSQAVGVPFASLLVTLTGSDLIDAFQITRSGRAVSTIEFHEDALIAAILAGLQAACDAGNQASCDSLAAITSQIEQHPNWIQWAVVTRLEVLGKEYSENLPGCSISAAVSTNPPNFSGCDLEDALGNRCVAPTTVLANPKNFAGKAFDYVCTEACHDFTGTTCPPSLPLP